MKAVDPAKTDTISAAVAASAEGFDSGRLDLETALMEAALFSRLAYHAVCGLGFENIEPPRLDSKDSELVYWAICELRGRLDDARAIFEADTGAVQS